MKKLISILLLSFLLLINSGFIISDETEEDILISGTVEETEHQDPCNSSLLIDKTLISGVWHVACDVMGNKKWVKDEISNPEGIPSKEGHRLAYCGDPSHWIIYLD